MRCEAHPERRGVRAPRMIRRELAERGVGLVELGERVGPARIAKRLGEREMKLAQAIVLRRQLALGPLDVDAKQRARSIGVAVRGLEAGERDDERQRQRIDVIGG